MNKAIFWDLLGTLGGDSKTLINDFAFFDNAIKSLQIAKQNGFLNILVTNQSAIGHGRLSIFRLREGSKGYKKDLINWGL